MTKILLAQVQLAVKQDREARQRRGGDVQYPHHYQDLPQGCRRVQVQYFYSRLYCFLLQILLSVCLLVFQLRHN